MLASIPQDMKFFRETTSGHVIIMGRKTLESFPGGNPLKNRVNIVLTKNRDYKKENAIIVHDIEGLKETLKNYENEEIFVIGGDSVYRQLIELCDTAYVTKIDREFDADTFFVNLDQEPAWQLAEKSEVFEHDGMKYCFTTYNHER